MALQRRTVQARGKWLKRLHRAIVLPAVLSQQILLSHSCMHLLMPAFASLALLMYTRIEELPLRNCGSRCTLCVWSYVYCQQGPSIMLTEMVPLETVPTSTLTPT